MIQLLTAWLLFILAAARIPAMVRNSRDMVFRGANFANLAMHSSLIIGLWYLRCAVLEAIMPPDTRRALIRTLPLTATLILQLLFFALTGPTTTTVSWGLYHDRLPAALFSAVLIVFIGWVCSGVVVACFRYIPRMRRSFKAGFTMVGTGCVLGMVVSTKFTIGLLSIPLPALETSKATRRPRPGNGCTA